MNSENKSAKTVCEVHRTDEEILARINEIRNEIIRNDIWIDTGIISKTQDPSSVIKQDILNGKILELKWILGEEVMITDGLI